MTVLRIAFFILIFLLCFSTLNSPAPSKSFHYLADDSKINHVHLSLLQFCSTPFISINTILHLFFIKAKVTSAFWCTVVFIADGADVGNPPRSPCLRQAGRLKSRCTVPLSRIPLAWISDAKERNSKSGRCREVAHSGMTTLFYSALFVLCVSSVNNNDVRSALLYLILW